MERFDRPTRWLIGAGAVVAALAIVAIIVTLTVGRSEPDALPTDSPEGTVQRYLQAIADRDYDTAYGLVNTAPDAPCTIGEFRDAARWFEGRQFSARLLSTRSLGDETEVGVRISESSDPPPFGRGETGQDVYYRLAKVDGAWRLTSFGYPVSGCSRPRVLPAERVPATPLPRSTD